jgi:hypothetical protein
MIYGLLKKKQIPILLMKIPRRILGEWLIILPETQRNQWLLSEYWAKWQNHYTFLVGMQNERSRDSSSQVRNTAKDLGEQYVKQHILHLF